MMVKSTATALLLLCGAIASPILPPASTEVDSAPKPDDSASIYDWAEGWTKDYTIHPSCNSTLRRQLREGLDEAVALAEHAKDHLLKFGAESDFVQKYFGNGSTAPPVGWYDRIVNADKTGVVFRCDDPDRNCATQDRTPNRNTTHSHLIHSTDAEPPRRMGRPLARRKRDPRNRHLPALVRDPAAAFLRLQPGLHGRRVQGRNLLGD